MSSTRSWRELRAATIDTPQKEAAVDRERQLLDLTRRLHDLRRQLGLSQAELAQRLGTSQANISRIECEDDLKLSTLDGYVAALGGRLELHAVFGDDEDVVIA